MTSRVSFHKLIIETLRRHLAAVLITVLVFFLHIVAFFLNVQNILNEKIMEDIIDSHFPPTRGTEHVKEGLLSLASPNVLNMMIAIFLGSYLAFEFFRYMHSRKESDFYDSMPIRKEKWFLNLLASSIGLFVVLTTITYMIELSIIYGVGYGSKQIVMSMLWNLLCTVGTFIICWVTTCLVMIMTGHSVIAFVGFGAISCYIPLIIGYLIPLYANTFFETYVLRDLPDSFYYFSPITLAYKTTHNYGAWNIKEHWCYIVGCYAFALIVGLIAYFLFLRRPSESAGRAMAFEKLNPLIRILLVIPLSLYAGLFFNEITSIDSTGWLLFGVIFASCLLHGIIESIFQFDIKALLCKKKQLLFTVLFCLAFVFVFWADILQFDQFIPAENNIKSIKIDTYLFEQNGKYFEEFQDGLSGEYIDDALAVIHDIRNHMNPSDSENYIYTNDFTITYEMKNGSVRQRRYSYYGNEYPDSLDKLSTTKEFKDDYCILYHLDEIKISSLSVYNGVETFNLNLTDEQLKEFSEIYLEEYSKLTLTESLNKVAAYKLIIHYPVEGREYDNSTEYKIYNHFNKSIAFLSTHNVVSFYDSENIKLENLEIYSDKYGNNGPQYVSNVQQLNELKEYFVLGDFIYHVFEQENDYAYGNLRCVSNGNTRYLDVYIKHSDLSKILNK